MSVSADGRRYCLQKNTAKPAAPKDEFHQPFQRNLDRPDRLEKITASHFPQMRRRYLFRGHEPSHHLGARVACERGGVSGLVEVV
jgi:hypothetical protein